MRHRNPQSGKLPLKLIIIVVVVLAGGAFAAVQLRGGSSTEKEQGDEVGESSKGKEGEQKQEPEAPAQTVSLGDEFLVNIRSGDGQLRYLKTDICLVVHEAQAEGGKRKETKHGHDEAVEEKLPPAAERYARDVAIAVLSNQQFETLRSAAGQQKLKGILQQKLDAILENYRVSDVLFTSFVMQ